MGKQAKLLILIEDPVLASPVRHIFKIITFSKWVRSVHLYSPPSSIRIGPTVNPISSSPSSNFPLQGTLREFAHAHISNNLSFLFIKV